MKNLLRTMAVITGAFAFGSASAIPVTLNFTADNEVRSGGLCDDMSCLVGTSWGNLGTLSNANNWTRSDSISLDLAPGTYWFTWHVINYGTGSTRNPVGLLAEILTPDAANYSSEGWEYSVNRAPGSWAATTSYLANGAANIWTQVNNGPVAGISSNAQWIWSNNNFNAQQDNSLWIRTSITVSVPEPATIGLLGLTLLGSGFLSYRRRR